jgi:hypothetical protein
MASPNRSGYDDGVAVEDEARARTALLQMQQRISQGPHHALGVTHAATYSEVRTAFLQLTKQFHPARFARMSVELQRFSNEVFLGLRSAHDTLVNGSSGKHGATKSGAFPIIQAEGTGGTRTLPTTAFPPVQRPPAVRPNGTLPISSRPTTPGQSQSMPAQSQSMPAQSQSMPAQAPAVPQNAAPARPATPPNPIIPGAIPKTTQPIPKIVSAPAAARPALPPRPTGSMEALNPQTLRYSEPQKTPAPAFDERAALEQAFALISAKSWSAARQALHALAARVPQSKQYRSLLCYTRGREAQMANRPDEATLEFQRALQLDPDLGPAKDALTEIQKRR